MADSTMSPEASPGGAAEVRSRLITGVRRVNNLPLLLALGTVALFVIIVVSIMVDRASEKTSNAKPSDAAQDTLAAANKIANQAPDGATEVADAPVPPGNPPIPITPVNSPTPSPPATSAADMRRVQAEALREAIRAAKTRQFAEAVRSPTGLHFNNKANNNIALNNNSNNSDPASQLIALQNQLAMNEAHGQQPSAADLAALAMLSNQASMGNTGGSPQTTGQRSQGYGQFDNRTGSDRWAVNAQAQSPQRYQLRAGFVIPGTLISGVNGITSRFVRQTTILRT